MQQALVKWWVQNCGKFGVPVECLFAIPNGMRKGAVIGSILKREGVRAGVPDLMLAVSQWADPLCQICRHTGLFLELKTPTGIVSPEQVKYHAVLSAQGYKVVVVRTLQDGINQITTYLT